MDCEVVRLIDWFYLCVTVYVYHKRLSPIYTESKFEFSKKSKHSHIMHAATTFNLIKNFLSSYLTKLTQLNNSISLSLFAQLTTKYSRVVVRRCRF